MCFDMRQNHALAGEKYDTPQLICLPPEQSFISHYNMEMYKSKLTREVQTTPG